MPKVSLQVNVRGRMFVMELDPEQPAQAAMIGEMIVEKKVYELDTSELFIRLLQPGSVFIDVGAHIGWYTLLAARIVGPLGMIYALEPEPKNYEKLQMHLKMNGLNGLVRCSREAATSKNGTVELHINADNDGGHALWPCGNHEFNKKSKENPCSILVNGRTLDSVCRDNGIMDVDLVKIDTEGAELEVLRGAEELLSKKLLRNVIMEINDIGLREMGTNREELVSFMDGYGYLGTVIGEEEPGIIFNALFTPRGVRC